LINISDITLESNLIKIKNVTWTESGQYREIKSTKVGLAPLDNSNWSKGKCAFKLLQYASAGIPIISSNVGVNKTLINKYHAGLLVKENNDWIDIIGKLKSDKNLYKRLSKNTLSLSRAYDVNVNYLRMKKIICKL
jgi:glycosyltransferase involved in cell wall biosynthesis